jgi:hypothetical protein
MSLDEIQNYITDPDLRKVWFFLRRQVNIDKMTDLVIPREDLPVIDDTLIG